MLRLYRSSPPCLPRVVCLLLAPLLVSAGGCDNVPDMVGKTGKYLFVARDAVGAPGQPNRVGARLMKGSFLDDAEDRQVRFYNAERLLAQTQTDDEGLATFEYTPTTSGDHFFEARCATPDDRDHPEARTQAIMAVRPAYTPLCVVDLDQTVVDGGSADVLRGDPPPMEHSRRVMERLAIGHLVVYLTARPEYLAFKSRQWLSRNRFPRAPMFLADKRDLPAGSRHYKNRVLAGLRRDFTGVGVGIGNTVGDIQAYASNDLKPIFLVYLSPKDRQSKSKLREKIETIRDLPAGTDVAWDWPEVEAAVFDGKKLPPELAIRRLEGMIAGIRD